MAAFSPSIDELRRQVDAELARVLEERAAALPEADLLVAEIMRLTRAGGKRLRPAFCYWGYRAAGGSPKDAIVRAAASLELLHTFAIVHDDIMDASDERRGQPTVHELHGAGVALLAGDLALVFADHAFTRAGFPSQIVVRAFEGYSRMRQEVIAGQYLDLKHSGDTDMTVGEARKVAVLKSGRYSIQEPLWMGAALAGADRATADALARFGAPLGEAFQLRDDLLGTFGDRERTGKPVDSDIREGKRNVLYAHAAHTLSGDERSFFRARWGAADLSSEEVQRLRCLVESSGARDATEQLLDELVATAVRELERLAVGPSERAALEALVFLSTDLRI